MDAQEVDTLKAMMEWEGTAHGSSTGLPVTP